ncbi:unnamed protein product, partial [Candidula unifasciata]
CFCSASAASSSLNPLSSFVYNSKFSKNILHIHFKQNISLYNNNFILSLVMQV